MTKKKLNSTHRHGKSESSVYYSWRHMLSRCRDPNNKRYQHYGGRGISVCERWLDFRNFLADMGEPPSGRTIDRIDPNGNYCPENCRWADQVQQNNNRTNNATIVIDGVRYTAQQLSRITGVPRETVRRKIRNGTWDAGAREPA